MHRSRNFRQVGFKSVWQKKLWRFFVCFFMFSPQPIFFFSPQPILQKSNGQFQRNLSFFKVPVSGGPTFSRGGGSNFFQGGSNCLFPIETHITCDFPEGVRTPCPPSGSALVNGIQIHISWINFFWTLLYICISFFINFLYLHSVCI